MINVVLLHLFSISLPCHFVSTFIISIIAVSHYYRCNCFALGKWEREFDDKVSGSQEDTFFSHLFIIIVMFF